VNGKHELIGKRVKDSITGVVGVVTCYAEYITGPDRVTVEAVDAGGRSFEMHADVERVTVVE